MTAVKLLVLTTVLLAYNVAWAAAPEQACQVKKNLFAGRYLHCRYDAEAQLRRRSPTTRYTGQIERCAETFTRRWERITESTVQDGSACIDSHLNSSTFKAFFDSHTEEVALLLGKGNKLSFPAKRCRLRKNRAAGEYLLCRFKAESVYARTANTTRFNRQVTRCERGLRKRWRNISRQAEQAKRPCYDSDRTFSEFKSILDSHTFTVRNVLAGSDELLSSVIAATNSPLTLLVNGTTVDLTITNTSSLVKAIGVASDFADTTLAGNVTETDNNCAELLPEENCVLRYTPGNTVVAQTDFSIKGSNTNTVTATMAIQSGSTLDSLDVSTGPSAGGVPITLTGTALTNASNVTFGGVAATTVNVVNSTTVTAVTPAHAVGTVDVVIDTPAGGATLSNSFTYVTNAVGQETLGGIIACLDGGMEDLIASSTDNSTATNWGGSGVTTSAQSTSDGNSNTVTIVATVGAGSYAAEECETYEVDSQGNTPCQAGNACYQDWFLPAQDQLNCLFNNRVAIGSFANASYWSSTEFAGSPSNFAFNQSFTNGFQASQSKASIFRVRCVRSLQ